MSELAIWLSIGWPQVPYHLRNASPTQLSFLIYQLSRNWFRFPARFSISENRFRSYRPLASPSCTEAKRKGKRADARGAAEPQRWNPCRHLGRHATAVPSGFGPALKMLPPTPCKSTKHTQSLSAPGWAQHAGRLQPRLAFLCVSVLLRRRCRALRREGRSEGRGPAVTRRWHSPQGPAPAPAPPPRLHLAPTSPSPPAGSPRWQRPCGRRAPPGRGSSLGPAQAPGPGLPTSAGGPGPAGGVGGGGARPAAATPAEGRGAERSSPRPGPSFPTLSSAPRRSRPGLCWALATPRLSSRASAEPGGAPSSGRPQPRLSYWGKRGAGSGQNNAVRAPALRAGPPGCFRAPLSRARQQPGAPGSEAPPAAVGGWGRAQQLSRTGSANTTLRLNTSTILKRSLPNVKEAVLIDYCEGFVFLSAKSLLRFHLWFKVSHLPSIPRWEDEKAGCEDESTSLTILVSFLWLHWGLFNLPMLYMIT